MIERGFPKEKRQQIIKTKDTFPLMINLLNQICLLFEIHRIEKVMTPTLNKILVIPFLAHLSGIHI